MCVEREETIEDDDKEKKEIEEINTEDDDEEIEGTFLASINLSTCRETLNKYECITK